MVLRCFEDLPAKKDIPLCLGGVFVIRKTRLFWGPAVTWKAGEITGGCPLHSDLPLLTPSPEIQMRLVPLGIRKKLRFLTLFWQRVWIMMGITARIHDSDFKSGQFLGPFSPSFLLPANWVCHWLVLSIYQLYKNWIDIGGFIPWYLVIHTWFIEGYSKPWLNVLHLWIAVPKHGGVDSDREIGFVPMGESGQM